MTNPTAITGDSPNATGSSASAKDATADKAASAPAVADPLSPRRCTATPAATSSHSAVSAAAGVDWLPCTARVPSQAACQCGGLDHPGEQLRQRGRRGDEQHRARHRQQPDRDHPAVERAPPQPGGARHREQHRRDGEAHRAPAAREQRGERPAARGLGGDPAAGQAEACADSTPALAETC
ncbi:hypothetical protein AB0F92_29060 [Kitasatospora aureofaciens]|uniref:hypothetical protein n=1 Tax=Kitasatospora aureofaciens TaxID=1894 RepID=UPI0033F64A4E